MHCTLVLMLEFIHEHFTTITSRTNVMTLAFAMESSLVAMAINLISSSSLFAGVYCSSFYPATLPCYSHTSPCSRV